MNAKETKTYRKLLAINDLIDFAQNLLDGKHDILKGVDSLLDLATLAGVSDQLPFADQSLYHFSSDLDDLPISDSFRAKCSPQYLKEQEPRIADRFDVLHLLRPQS